MLKYVRIAMALRRPLKPFVRYLSVSLDSSSTNEQNKALGSKNEPQNDTERPQSICVSNLDQKMNIQYQSLKNKFKTFSSIHRFKCLIHENNLILEPEGIRKAAQYLSETQNGEASDTLISKEVTLSRLIEHIDPRHYSYLCMTLVDSGYIFSSAEEDVKAQKTLLKRLDKGNDSDYACFLSCMTDGSDENIRRSFLQVYSIEMCTYAIRCMINKGRNKEVRKFLELLLERLLRENKLPLNTDVNILADKEEFLPFFEMLNHFKIRRNKLPILRPKFVHHLILSVLETKILVSRRIESTNIEGFLKILYRYLSFEEEKDPFIIRRADSAFLLFIAKMPNSSVEVLLAYTMTMFPRSQDLFVSLRLIMKDAKGTYCMVHDNKEIPPCNIRRELCLPNEMPSMEVMRLIYDRLFFGSKLSKWEVGAAFSKYIEEVQRVQADGTLLHHPFSKCHHSSIILESFIRYIITWLKKPVFAYNRVLLFLDSTYCSDLKSRYLSILISDLSRRSLPHACSLLSRAERDTKIDVDAFFSVINEMMRLGDSKNALAYYIYACRSERISKAFSDRQVAKICIDFKWKVPKYWLINRVSTNFGDYKLEKTNKEAPLWLQHEKPFRTNEFISFLDEVHQVNA